MPTDSGYFSGVLDEARVWNRALTQAEILATINEQITSGNGLVARWGLNEGSGAVVHDSIATAADGTITGSAYAWVPGAPFNLNVTPGAPTLVAPADQATGVPTSAPLIVHVTDPTDSELTVAFYGRPKVSPPEADFTLIAIPDPQYYAASYPSIYNAQMNWVVANKTTSNITYVASLGDNVDSSTNTTQWTTATTAWDILTTGGVPYGLGLGNHDGAPSATTNFNTYFGGRLASQFTYGGRYGTSDYDNTYALFSAGGMDFVVVFLEYDTTMNTATHPVLVWANGVLQANPTRRAIVVTHDLLNSDANATFTTQGSNIYQALKGNANLFLMLGGHLDGSKQRTDVYDGHIVYSLRSDYQFVDSQQSGYLRIMRFSPAGNKIYVTTYSPNQAKYLSDSTNQFSLDYAMSSSTPFTLIGTAANVPAGSDATVTWSGLQNATEYEWYAVSSNSADSAASPTWSFTTATTSNHAPVITESDPVAVTMSEDGTPTAFDLTLHATDADLGDTLTWSIFTPASHGTASASSTGASVIVGYTPGADYNGIDSFVVQILDGNGGTDTTTVNVTIEPVNDTPAVTNPGDQTNADGDIVSLQIAASDVDIPADTLSYVATGLPDGLTINTISGLIAGTIASTASANSPYNAAITVSDGNDGSTTVNFTWTVNPASGPCESDDPDLVGCWLFNEGSGTTTADGSGEGNTGTLYDSTMWTSDRFGNTGRALTFNGTSQYVKVADADSLDVTGDITMAAWVKPEKLATQYLVKKAVSGTTNGYELGLAINSGTTCAPGTNPCAFGRFNQTATPTDAYRINSMSNYSATDPWTLYAVTYTTADNTLRIYRDGVLSKSRVVSGLAIGTNTLFLGFGAQLAGTDPTPSSFFTGSLDDIRIYKRALSLQDIETLAGVNRTPVLALVGNKSSDELTLLTFTASASDLDAPPQTLAFSLVGAPEGAAIDGTTGGFTWTLTEAQGPNSYPFTVRVCDNGMPVKCDEEAITVTVSEVNVAPELAAIGAKNVAESSELSFTATATDADLPANTLTFSLAGAPTGAAINGSTGAFTWTPTEAQVGNHTFTVKVCDNGTPALCDEEEITVTVVWTLAHALTYVQNNTTLEGNLDALTATFPASIPAVVVAEPYKINSLMTLGAALPAGSLITIVRDGQTVVSNYDLAGDTEFWFTDLIPGAVAADFDGNYAGAEENYVITISGNTAPIATTLTIQSIISRNGFTTEKVVLATHTVDVVQDILDLTTALAYVQANTSISGELDDLTATFPPSIPAVVVAEPYKINSLMTLGAALPAGSLITIVRDGQTVVSNYDLTGDTEFWFTELIPGAVAADFDGNYAGAEENYVITISGNTAPIDTTLTVQSIISRDGFTTEKVVLDSIVLNVVMDGKPANPEVLITKLGDDVKLSWLAVTTDTNNNTLINAPTYKLFQSDILPYFTPADEYRVSGSDYNGTDLEYWDDEVAGSPGMCFYIVRATNSAGDSNNSKRVGAFTFQLVPGQ